MELLSDKSGSVSFGWVKKGVYLCRFSGAISDSLGAAHVRRVQAILEEVAKLRYFADARDVTSYDLLARSAFVRLVLMHRKKFEELVVLTWAEGGSVASQAFTSAVGEPLVLLTSNADFDRRLTLAAPRAREALANAEANGTDGGAVRLAVSVKPGRSLRPSKGK
jgi:hypothetical protein